jgi:hypothetical protein
MASKKLPAKPTMRQAFQAAQGPAVARPNGRGNGQGPAVGRPYSEDSEDNLEYKSKSMPVAPKGGVKKPKNPRDVAPKGPAGKPMRKMGKQL